MPKIAYIERKFTPDCIEIIDRANAIIADYMRQNFKLTLRQLYYVFISKDAFPASWIDEEYNRKQGLDPSTKNTIKNYKRLGGIINDGRMAGKIDWSVIEDRTREVVTPTTWEHPRNIIKAVAQQFRIDKWENQEFRPEVWIEKEALAGVIEGVCTKNGVSFLACRGYTSQSEMWSSAMRLQEFAEAGQKPIILHLGDHDPSGIDMTRDITDRLETFMGGLKVDRLALNMDQVRKYNPPPNPAKATDARFAGYEDTFGNESWELDALEPRLMVELIENAIDALRDQDKWEEKVAEENRYRELLLKTSTNWNKVEKMFDK